MDTLPRPVLFLIVRLVIRDLGRDGMRLFGIQPGKLQMPRLERQRPIISYGHEKVTLRLLLPNSFYVIQRFPEALDDERWETCEIRHTRGLPFTLFETTVRAFSRTSDGEYVMTQCDFNDSISPFSMMSAFPLSDDSE